MDGGRTPQPADRRVVNRAEPSSRPVEEPQPVRETPRRTYESASSSSHSSKVDTSRKRRIIVPLAIILAVILAALIGWFTWSGAQNTGLAIDKSKYQAVFFTNGQVYFGKLQASGSDYLKMTDIYYLQTQATDGTSANPQQTSSDANNVQLIKLGDEIHGPEDAMIISKDQVLFYENLKTDGKVAKSIANYKTNTKQ